MEIRSEWKKLLFLCSATFAAAHQPFHTMTDLQAGRTLDVLSSYGYLYLTLHVTPIKHPLPWLILEETRVIFEDNPGIKISLDHKGDFLLDFCNSLQQLVKAFFRNFTIEGLENPYKAYAGVWHKSKLAKTMGISEEYVNGKYNYILVRLIKKHTSGWIGMNDSLRLTNYSHDWVNLVSPGDTVNLDQFLELVGTHYISAFVTGDIVYQVFVYQPKKFAKIREMRIQQNMTQWTQEDIDLVFSPSFAEHIGLVMDVSQNDTVADWLKRNINYRFFTYQYQNLLKLYRHRRLKNQLLDLLPDESIVNLELKTVSPIIRNNDTRHWVEEVLNNKLALWDTSM